MINGGLRILYIKKSDVFLPIGCLTSDGFDEDTETIPSTTRDNAGWRTNTLTLQGYSISFEGILIKSDTSIITYNDLVDFKRSRSIVEWQILDDGLLFQTGFAQITELSTSSSLDEFITFTGSLLGYEKPIIYNLTTSITLGGLLLTQNSNALTFN